MMIFRYRHLTSLHTGTQEPPLLEETKVLSSLTMIFSNNVMGFAGGSLGAVNGMVEDGGVDRHSVLHSHWSRSTEARLSLVESFIVLLRQLSYARKNQLGHPTGLCLLLAGSLWHKG